MLALRASSGSAAGSAEAAPSAAGAAKSDVDASWLDAARAKLLRDSEAWRASLATDLLNDDDGDDSVVGAAAAAAPAAAVGGDALGSAGAGASASPGPGVSSTSAASGAGGYLSAMDNFAAIESRLAGSS